MYCWHYAHDFLFVSNFIRTFFSFSLSLSLFFFSSIRCFLLSLWMPVFSSFSFHFSFYHFRYHMRSFIKVNCSSTHRYTCSPSFFYICSHEIQSNITCTIIKKKERRSNNQSVTLFFPVSKSWVLRTYGFVWLCVAASECVLYRK